MPPKNKTDGDGSELEAVIENEENEGSANYTAERPAIIHQEGNIFPEYYLIEVVRFPNEVKTALDEWIYFFKNSEIPDEFTSKNIQSARNELRLIQMERKERRAFERFQMARSSCQDEVESNKELAREEGHAQGLRQGIEQGIEQNRQNLALQMLANGEPIDKIMLYSTLSKDEIQRLQSELG